MNKIRINVTILIIFITAGCATVKGPHVSDEEILAAQKILEVKALQFQINQVKRINTIGYDLVKIIPQEDIKTKSRPFLGLFFADRNDITNRLFQKEPESGIYVVFTLENTPAADAGILPGDLIKTINGKNITRARKLVKLESRLEIGQEVTVELERGNERLSKSLLVDELRVDVRFTAVDKESVNAAASGDRVYVTYGLLNFVRSDDELASVLAHELAHLTQGHIKRRVGGEIIKTIAAVGLGIGAEAVSPGAGGVVYRGIGGIGDVFSKKFSRNLEREADYYGAKYIFLAGYDPSVAASAHERFAIEIPRTMISGYLSSHPSSPERTVRIGKAIEEFKAGVFRDTNHNDE